MNNQLIKSLITIGIASACLMVVTPSWADPKPGSFAEQCVQQAEDVFANDAIPRGHQLQACKEGLQRAADEANWQSQQTTATPGSCPAQSHDILVTTIGGLRDAAANAMPGSVIGIDGMLSIHDDAGGDLIVTADGVTITCASDNSGVAGNPAVATIWVQADDVTIDHLTVDGGFSSGIVFGDWFGDGTIVADRGTASNNTASCGFVCIGFIGATGSVATGNNVTGAYKDLGIVAAEASDSTIRDNVVENCLICIYLPDSSVALVTDNVASYCEFNCIGSPRTDDIEITQNEVSMASNGIYVSSTENAVISRNDVSYCVFDCITSRQSPISHPSSNVTFSENTGSCYIPGEVFAASCIRARETSNVTIVDNVFTAEPAEFFHAIGAINGAGLLVRNNVVSGGGLFVADFVSVDIEDNRFENCSRTCINGFSGIGDARIVRNFVSGSALPVEDRFGISVEPTMGDVLIEDNEVYGFLSVGIHGFQPGDLPYTMQVLKNDVDISALESFFTFSNGISLGRLNDSVIAHNTISVQGHQFGARGIDLSGEQSIDRFWVNGVLEFESMVDEPARNNVVRNNIIRNATTGMVIRSACNNEITGNNVAASKPVYFGMPYTLGWTETDPYTGDFYESSGYYGGTGGNVYKGNTNGIAEVLESSLRVFPPFDPQPTGETYIDCDGDGAPDPNNYSGKAGK